MRRGVILGCLILWSCGLAAARAAEPVQWQELYEVLKANLAGTTPIELNRAAVSGLIEQLSPRVQLLDESAPGKGDANTNGPALSSNVFDRAYGYIRLARLGPASGRDFQATYDGLAASNKLRGLVVDLRFSSGGDYGAAVAVADRFFESAQDLVDWGEGMKRSSTKSNALTLPTTVLVNRKTSGAPEVLAGILRHGDVALLVGTNSAGQAGVTRDFPLKTGQRVRVAVAPVKVMKDQELPFAGIAADIGVPVEPEEERLNMEDAFRAAKVAAGVPGESTLASTNNRPRRRMNEADLVRMSRDGQDPREISTPQTTLRGSGGEGPVVPQVSDPVLARALDILKGLAVVQRFRGQ